MKKWLASILTCATLFLCAFFVMAADAPFALFIPAESVKIDGSSISMVNADGAIDGKAITCTEKADDAFGDGFTLTFTVPADGDYIIWGRVFYPSISNNSLHYSVDGGDGKIWDFVDEDAETSPCYKSWQYFYLTDRVEGDYDDETMYGPWTIENSQWRHTPHILPLKAGEHSIHFTGREADWLIDEFIITSLEIEDYDPNACPENKYYAECKFCGTDWKHYAKDIFAVTGQTAESYFNTVLYPAAPETTAETISEQAVDSTPATAPKTLDWTAAAAVAAVLSAAGFTLSKKK